MKTASWVIVDKKTGEGIIETFSEKVASSVNTEKYEAVPILKYLQDLNEKIKHDEAIRNVRND